MRALNEREQLAVPLSISLLPLFFRSNDIEVVLFGGIFFILSMALYSKYYFPGRKPKLVAFLSVFLLAVYGIYSCSIGYCYGKYESLVSMRPFDVIYLIYMVSNCAYMSIKYEALADSGKLTE